MSEFNNTIDLLGDDVVAASIISKTITEYNDDSLNSVGGYAFANCSKLTSVNLPNVTSVGRNAFDGCEKLMSVDLPNAQKAETYTFSQCRELTSVNLSNAVSIGIQTFASCYVLPFLDLPKVAMITGQASFSYCRMLTTLVLRSPTVCIVENVNTCNNSPFNGYEGRTGTVYVPQALIEEYQNATNWSTLYAAGTCNFVAIEGSEYE